MREMDTTLQYVNRVFGGGPAYKAMLTGSRPKWPDWVLQTKGLDHMALMSISDPKLMKDKIEVLMSQDWESFVPAPAPAAPAPQPSAPSSAQVLLPPPPPPAPPPEKKSWFGKKTKPAAPPAPPVNGAKPSAAPAAPGATKPGAPDAAQKHWFKAVTVGFQIGIGLLGVLVAIAFFLDAKNPVVSKSIVANIPLATNIQEYAGPFWNTVFLSIDWANIPKWLISVLTIMLIFEVLVMLDVLNNFTSADWPGFAGQILSLGSPMILNPIWSLSVLLSGLVLVHRDKESSRPPLTTLAVIGAVAFLVSQIQPSAQPTTLSGTLLTWISQQVSKLTPENTWYVAFPMIGLFLVSYIKAKNFDTDGMAGVMLAQGTTVAITGTVPYMAGVHVTGTAYIAVISLYGIFAFVLAFQDTATRLAKPFVGFIANVIYMLVVTGLSSVFQIAAKAKLGWNVGFLCTSVLAALLLGLVTGLTQMGHASEGETQGKEHYKKITSVWGDGILFYILFFPSTYQVYLVILWMISLYTKSSLI